MAKWSFSLILSAKIYDSFGRSFLSGGSHGVAPICSVSATCDLAASEADQLLSGLGVWSYDADAHRQHKVGPTEEAPNKIPM